MKKVPLLLALLLSLLLIFSCSNDTPENNGDGEPSSVDSSVFTFDRSAIKSVVSSSLTMKAGNPGRAIAGESGAWLMNWNRDDSMAPLVFKNGDKYVIFLVKETYIIDESVFAIDFTKMIVSSTKPSFLMEENAGTRGGVEKIPVIENVTNKKEYCFFGQLLVNTKNGKASLLNNIDFSRFEDVGDGRYQATYEYEAAYRLDDAYALNDKLYVPTSVPKGSGYERNIMKIDLEDMKTAEPMVHPDFIDPVRIAGLSSKNMIIDEAGYGTNWNIDIERKIPPFDLGAYDEPDFVISDKDSGRSNYTVKNVGEYARSVLIDDVWWNIAPKSTRCETYFLTKDGDTLIKDVHWQDGIILGEERIEGSSIRVKDDWHLTIDRVPYYLTIDENKNYVLNNDEKGVKEIAKNLNGHNVKTLIGYLEEGVTYLDGTPVEYPLAKDEEGNNLPAFLVNGDICYVRSGEDRRAHAPWHETLMIAAEITTGSDTMKPSVGRYSQTKMDVPYELDLHYKMLNMRESSVKGVYDIYFYEDYETQIVDGKPMQVNGAAPTFYHVSFNTNDLTLELKNYRTVPEVRIKKGFYYSDVHWFNRRGDENFMAWSDDGNTMYWADSAKSQLCAIDMRTMEVERVAVPGLVPVLSKVGDKIVYSAFITGTKVGTYRLDMNDGISGTPELYATEDMAITPLVTIDSASL